MAALQTDGKMEKDKNLKRAEYKAEGRRRMEIRKKKRLAKFTKNHKESWRHGGVCPCCGHCKEDEFYW